MARKCYKCDKDAVEGDIYCKDHQPTDDSQKKGGKWWKRGDDDTDG